MTGFARRGRILYVLVSWSGPGGPRTLRRRAARRRARGVHLVPRRGRQQRHLRAGDPRRQSQRAGAEGHGHAAAPVGRDRADPDQDVRSRRQCAADRAPRQRLQPEWQRLGPRDGGARERQRDAGRHRRRADDVLPGRDAARLAQRQRRDAERPVGPLDARRGLRGRLRDLRARRQPQRDADHRPRDVPDRRRASRLSPSRSRPPIRA